MAVYGGLGAKSSALFQGESDDKDVDDFEFLNHPPQGKSGYMLNEGKKNDDWEQNRLQLLEETRQIEERTLQGTKFTLGLIHESEQIGVATADELVRQREQLENVENTVDEINSTMRISQKHLTSMKSLFGGIKSYFSRSSSNPQIPVKPVTNEEHQNPSALQTTVDNVRASSLAESQSQHPALKLRGIDTSGFGSPEDEQPVESSHSAYSARIEKQIDTNLDQMNVGINRLKSLAIGLGDEISEQNTMLDRITGKVEKSDESLQYQNRQIRRILKK